MILFKSWFVCIFTSLLFSVLLFFVSFPVLALSNQPIVLTLELLQERVKNPIVKDGNLIVDLQNTIIDLRPENSIFRDNFYQILRKELQKTSTKNLGLDLSHSVINGDFIGSNLGLRTPLYAQGIAPLFNNIEKEKLENLRFVCLQSLAIDFFDSKDCKFLLGNRLNTSSDIAVFRGVLNMVGSHFNGEVSFANTFFLQSVNADGAVFFKSNNFQETRFANSVNFHGAIFHNDAIFQGGIFFGKANFSEAIFWNYGNFQGGIFSQEVKFNQVKFKNVVKFNSSYFQDKTDFTGGTFTHQVQFNKVNFQNFLLFADVIFEQAVIFRESEFNQSVSFRGATILTQADFTDAKFAKRAFLNVPGLVFNSNQGKILGTVGEIGKKFIVPRLSNNQSVLRNLSQNFRQQQQISDANQLEYTKQRLYLIDLSRRLSAINVNTATLKRLVILGFSDIQAKEIKQRRDFKHFQKVSELLTLADVDLETYNKLSSRLIASEPLFFTDWFSQSLTWLLLSVLLLLSGYGTNFWLVFGIGGLIIAWFGLLFWLVDRYRRLIPHPIIPTYYESISVLITFVSLISLSLIAIFKNAPTPWLTLFCLFMIIVPIPVILLWQLYQRGRYHDLMDISYFTEDGTLRQLRLLIGRLPVIPRNITFRERYMSLLWNKHWNWLNYYDFSLNNLVRLGFNDIRLRDEHLPGIIASLAWYEWTLGLFYIMLAGWTLSRTIPGLNLLIYLK